MGRQRRRRRPADAAAPDRGRRRRSPRAALARRRDALLRLEPQHDHRSLHPEDRRRAHRAPLRRGGRRDLAAGQPRRRVPPLHLLSRARLRAALHPPAPRRRRPPLPRRPFRHAPGRVDQPRPPSRSSTARPSEGTSPSSRSPSARRSRRGRWRRGTSRARPFPPTGAGSSTCPSRGRWRPWARPSPPMPRRCSRRSRSRPPPPPSLRRSPWSCRASPGSPRSPGTAARSTSRSSSPTPTTTARSTRATTAFSSARPLSFEGGKPVAGAPEQLTDTSWNCEYPSPFPDRLIATCSQDASLDVYSLPLDGEVPAAWTMQQLENAIDDADTRVVEQLLTSRKLARETTPGGRRLAMLDLAMVHLELEEFRAADYYAELIHTLHDQGTAGISTPLRLLVEQRRAVRRREQGRLIEGFRAEARARLDKLVPGKSASPMAEDIIHLVRSEIFDSLGEITEARTELQAVTVDETTAALHHPGVLRAGRRVLPRARRPRGARGRGPRPIHERRAHARRPAPLCAGRGARDDPGPSLVRGRRDPRTRTRRPGRGRARARGRLRGSTSPRAPCSPSAAGTPPKRLSDAPPALYGSAEPAGPAPRPRRRSGAAGGRR